MNEHETFSGFFCEFCNMSFESYEDQRLHNCLEIKMEKPEFDQEPGYDINEEIKQENFDTGFSYDEKETLSKKLSKKLKNRTIINCEVCQEVFKSEKIFLNHILQVHNYTKRQYEQVTKSNKCELCPADFGRKEQLNAHISAVHEGKKPFQCDICHTGFFSNQGLKRHISNIHEGIRPFECDSCDATYPTKEQLKIHISGLIFTS